MLCVEKMWVVENLIVIDHGHGLASDKWKNVLLELARGHMKRVFVRWGLSLLNLFKIDKNGLHTVIIRIDP
jgi:hypothetical protein